MSVFSDSGTTAITPVDTRSLTQATLSPPAPSTNPEEKPTSVSQSLLSANSSTSTVHVVPTSTVSPAGTKSQVEPTQSSNLAATSSAVKESATLLTSLNSNGPALRV